MSDPNITESQRGPNLPSSISAEILEGIAIKKSPVAPRLEIRDLILDVYQWSLYIRALSMSACDKINIFSPCIRQALWPIRPRIKTYRHTRLGVSTANRSCPGLGGPQLRVISGADIVLMAMFFSLHGIDLIWHSTR